MPKKKKHTKKMKQHKMVYKLFLPTKRRKEKENTRFSSFSFSFPPSFLSLDLSLCVCLLQGTYL